MSEGGLQAEATLVCVHVNPYIFQQNFQSTINSAIFIHFIFPSMRQVISYKHRNLMDGTLGVFIENDVTNDVSMAPTNELTLDFTFNRFTTSGLEPIVVFMQRHESVVACVGWNHFTFPDFYKKLSNMGLSNWVEDGRIFMGLTEFDQKLDRIASMQMKTEGNLNNLASSVGTHLKEASMTRETSKNLANWGNNEREYYEIFVTSVFKTNLDRNNYTNVEEFPDKFCFIPAFGVEFATEAGMMSVEWDGIVTADKGGTSFIFLIEAKRTSQYKQMKTMPERLRITKTFIDRAKVMIDTVSSRNDKGRCFMFSNVAQSEIRGVLAADDISEAAYRMARENNFITISKSSDGYKLQGNL